MLGLRLKKTILPMAATLVLGVVSTFAVTAAPAKAATIVDLDASNTSALGSSVGDSWISCSVFCQGWNGSWGNVAKDQSGFNPSQARNAIIATGGTGLTSSSTYIKIDGYGSNVSSFTVDAPYFHLFDAGDLFLFRTFDSNGSPSSNPGTQTFTFFKVGTEGRPSNVGANGTIQPGTPPNIIPLPAGGLLLITALGGLGFAARRRHKAS